MKCADDKICFVEGDKLIPLVHPTEEDVAELKRLYRLENCETDRIDYGKFRYSVNLGDYFHRLRDVSKFFF